MHVDEEKWFCDAVVREKPPLDARACEKCGLETVDGLLRSQLTTETNTTG